MADEEKHEVDVPGIKVDVKKAGGGYVIAAMLPGHGENEPPKAPEEVPIVTHHTDNVGGRTLHYTVTTGMMQHKTEEGESEDNLFLMKAELEWLGYSVLAAANAKLGMELAIREKPDLLISDISMPVVDGYELIKSLRLAPEFGATPAIALTGFGLERDIERALTAGYDAHLSKPADSSVLNDLIKIILRY